jgi:putative Mg2+ transporter-C (MgtC) family protein
MGSAEIEIIVRLVLAVLLGGLVGYERERKGRPAGLRTHILVCLGATLLVLVADIPLRAENDLAARMNVLMRIAAGIITGVGFLGAGTIIRVRREPHGLTTAAMIWFAAALGVVIGSGYLWVAALAAFLCIALVVVLGTLERIALPHQTCSVVLIFSEGEPHPEKVLDILNKLPRVSVKLVGINRKPAASRTVLTCDISGVSPTLVEDVSAFLRTHFPKVEFNVSL